MWPVGPFPPGHEGGYQANGSNGEVDGRIGLRFGGGDDLRALEREDDDEPDGDRGREAADEEREQQPPWVAKVQRHQHDRDQRRPEGGGEGEQEVFGDGHEVFRLGSPDRQRNHPCKVMRQEHTQP
jgi:hypothetical protein